MNTDINNNKLNIDIQDNDNILNIRNNYVLTDIFNKYFDEEKHVPLLYLVLQTDTLNDQGLLDVKLLMLEKTKCKKQLKRLYLKEKLKLNINNLLMYTEYMQNLVKQKIESKRVQYITEHINQYRSILKIKENEIYLQFHPFPPCYISFFSFERKLKDQSNITNYELQEYLIEEDQV